MAETTFIQWTGSTLNPGNGCHRRTSGCDNCYAERETSRLINFPSTVAKDPDTERWEWTGEVSFAPHRLKQLRSGKARMVFVASMTDIFYKYSEAQLHTVFDAIEDEPRHSYQILTKRPERMLAFFRDRYASRPIPSNIWPGTSLAGMYEDQDTEMRMLDALLNIYHNIWLSFEPMLASPARLLSDRLEQALKYGGLRWIVYGGESGSRARPCPVDMIFHWILRCRGLGVPVFVKQLGTVWAKSQPGGMQLHGRKGQNIETWPEPLRVRQWPEGMER